VVKIIPTITHVLFYCFFYLPSDGALHQLLDGFFQSFSHEVFSGDPFPIKFGTFDWDKDWESINTWKITISQ
jgi:hypothetical protein